jgi:hypothetical protein
MALHRDRSRTYVGKLEAEGVNQRQGDGFRPIRTALPTCDTCGAMLLPVICSSCAARVHQGDNRTMASTTTLRTTVAIAATSMLEIRLAITPLLAAVERQR